MEFKDYYKILGLQESATGEEIKRAYRKLARKFHPDVSKESGAEAKFKEVREAYEVLKEPDKRIAYDRLRKSGSADGEFQPPPDWDAGVEFRRAGHSPRDREAFSDFFETLFGRGFGAAGSRPAYAAQGEDHYAKILIDIEDAYRGSERALSLQTPQLDAHGRLSVREHALKVVIPRGIRGGQHIRLAGQGMPGVEGGVSGDLYLEVRFKPHPWYSVEGLDVYLKLPVAPWEAALGRSVRIPTPDGPVEARVPAASRSGRKLRLKGRGIPGDPPGDFYAVLEIAAPPANTAAERGIYEEMERAFRFNPRADLGV